MTSTGATTHYYVPHAARWPIFGSIGLFPLLLGTALWLDDFKAGPWFALVGFGFDSAIEALSGGVIVWLFSGGRGVSHTAERRAQQLIAISYALLVAYIGVEAIRDLFGSHHPEASWVGIGLAAVTAPTMPMLARAKRDVGRKLSSSATVSEAGQNMICAYLSLALLVGLLANALLGWWWADPAAALVIAAVAGKEGIDAWRGESCDCC